MLDYIQTVNKKEIKIDKFMQFVVFHQVGQQMGQSLSTEKVSGGASVKFRLGQVSGKANWFGMVKDANTLLFFPQDWYTLIIDPFKCDSRFQQLEWQNGVGGGTRIGDLINETQAWMHGSEVGTSMKLLNGF